MLRSKPLHLDLVPVICGSGSGCGVALYCESVSTSSDAVSAISRGGFLIAAHEVDVQRDRVHPSLLTDHGLLLDRDYALGAIEEMQTYEAHVAAGADSRQFAVPSCATTAVLVRTPEHIVVAADSL